MELQGSGIPRAQGQTLSLSHSGSHLLPSLCKIPPINAQLLAMTLSPRSLPCSPLPGVPSLGLWPHSCFFFSSPTPSSRQRVWPLC